MTDVLELDGDGWRLGGEPWEPDGPFFAVLGDPIAHSLSPAMHNAALTERELEAVYLPLRIQAGQLRRLKEGPAARQLLGFNVTAPLKEPVAALCDGRTDQARELGAVNTVKVEDGRWLGHNTDSGGLLAVLSQVWPGDVRPEKVIVLGAGGSGRAAIDAVLRWGVPRLEVRNRSAAGQDRARAWLADRQSETVITVTGLVPDADPAPTGPTLWISCLAGGVSLQPFLPVAAGDHPAVLLDVRYGDQLPDEAPPLGFVRQDGLPMLLMQGGLSFAWWCGPPVPWQAMRAALD